MSGTENLSEKALGFRNTFPERHSIGDRRPKALPFPESPSFFQAVPVPTVATVHRPLARRRFSSRPPLLPPFRSAAVLMTGTCRPEAVSRISRPVSTCLNRSPLALFFCAGLLFSAR